MIEVEIPEPFGAERDAWHVVLDLANADLPVGALGRPDGPPAPARGGRHSASCHHRCRCPRRRQRSCGARNPSLLAAIVGKWRAFAEITAHSGDPDRHLCDAARLLTVVDPDAVTATRAQRTHLRRLLAEIHARAELGDGDADLVIDTLVLLTDS